MRNYNLGFISDTDILNHVKDTLRSYRKNVSMSEFNRNIVDPIKVMMDSAVYHKELKEIIDSECWRQMDKSNNNVIGYFHQNIFKYAGNDWIVPQAGFDVENKEKHIYVEMKNKHNTMNSSSSQKTYISMQQKLLEDDEALCLLVEVIAKTSQDVVWETSVNGKSVKHKRIRKMSIDKFYELVFDDDTAFYKLCTSLPMILEDAVSELEAEEKKKGSTEETVYDGLNQKSADILKSLLLMAFESYNGFDVLK